MAGEDHLGADRIHQRLLAYTRDLPTLGERTVTVPRQQKNRRKPGRKSSRVARVRVAAGPVSIAVPADCARGECQRASLDLWVVHVREIAPPKGEEPLEWVVLPNVAAGTFEQACERVDWYGCRPVVEELHKGMKTCCGIESMQFEHAERLEPKNLQLLVMGAEAITGKCV